MKPPTIRILTVIVILFIQCGRDPSGEFLEELLYKHMDIFQEILDHPEKYQLQILYSRIERDRHNHPHLTTFRYRIDPGEYFYPASMVKLPVALLALEKINNLKITGLTKFSEMITDSAYYGQSRMMVDSSAESYKPSVAHYIKKIFLVSDNDAFNRLYEFLGQEYINETLHWKGYEHARITHRLSIPLTPEENRHTNPIRFYNEDHQLLYQQDLTHADNDFNPEQKILLGDGYISNDSLIDKPMDFSSKNFIPLEELHQMLISVIFPQQVGDRNRFNLTNEDRMFLLKYMSMYPRESDDPNYGDKYEDNYCKFLIFGDQTGTIPGNIRIFNKIGLAYGFLVETAYVVDFDAKVEFFLSAVIHVNKNRIYNDGVYEYDSIGFPFMGNLGRMIYQYEKNRKKAFVPDLSELDVTEEP